jgi:hypothetical protein
MSCMSKSTDTSGQREQYLLLPGVAGEAFQPDVVVMVLADDG